jgi:hypothetical protein
MTHAEPRKSKKASAAPVDSSVIFAVASRQRYLVVMAARHPPQRIASRNYTRKSVAKAVPQSRCCVTIDWASERLAEELVEYVDAFNDDPVEAAEREPWNRSFGPSEWKNKKTTKFGVEVKTRVRSWEFNLRR